MSEAEAAPADAPADAPRFTAVVGVSATSKSETALLWAAEQVRAHDGTLLAVRAWRPPNPQATPAGTPASRIESVADAESNAERRLNDDVAAVLGDTVEYGCRLIHGGRRSALLKAARGADLLVVDAPRALTTGPMFAHRLVYAAACPVVVMPPRVSAEPASWLVRLGARIGRQVVRAAGSAGRPGRPPMH